MARPANIALQVVLSDAQLDELAERVARRLLTSQAGEAYDQENLPPGMTRRTFLTAARAGKFATRKVGRKVVADRAAVDAWHATLPSAKSAVKVASKAPANDVDPELERLTRLTARRRGA